MRRAARALQQQLRLHCGAQGQPSPFPFHQQPARWALPPRALATGLADVEPTVLAKARRLALAVGTGAGAFGALVGVGGGVLVVPAILSACPSIPQRVLSGTSLAVVVTTGSTAGLVYLGSGLVDATSACLIAAGAVVMAPLGARCTARFNSEVLRKILGWWLIGVAPLVPVKALLFASQGEGGADAAGADAAAPAAAAAGAGGTPTGAPAPGAPAAASAAEAGPAPPTFRPLRPRDAFILATGCLAGFMSGLLGIGGGTVVTPALALITGMPQTMVLGTSLAAMLPPSTAGLMQHARMGNIDWRMAASLAAGGLGGGFVGSHAALAAPPGVLEAAFAVGMLFLGRRMLSGAAQAAATRRGAAAAAAAVGRAASK